MEETVQEFKKKPTMRCGVSGCFNNTADNPHLKLFRVPNDSERKNLWLQQLKIEHDADSARRMLVCDAHFDNKYIQYNLKRSRLLKAAVPTLFLPTEEPQPPPPSPPSMSPIIVKVEPVDPGATPSTSHGGDGFTKPLIYDTPEIQRPIKRVKVKEEEGSLTVFVEEESDEEHEYIVVADKEQLQFKNKSPKKVYSMEFKMFALELYFKCPNSYRLLRNTFMLPRISTLYRLCIPQTTVISQSVLKALFIQANNMTAAQKQCVVCVGTIKMTPSIYYDSKTHKMFGFHEVAGVQRLEPAQNVLIVMVRGLFHKWKQAVALEFLADIKINSVDLIIDDVILKMFDVGLNVRVLMTDLGTERFSAPKDKGINPKSPFFLLNSKKIYYMNDPLLLMKNIHEHFVDNNIVFYSGLVAKWQYVVECYEHDCKKNMLRLAPKLSKDVINVNKEMNNLKFTVDLFSKATAAAMSTYIELKALPACAKDTVQWIVTMDKLMEMLNFSSIQPPENKKDLFTGNCAQVDFLIEMLSLFYKTRLLATNNTDVETSLLFKSENIPFVEGFRVTINALLLLYGDLKKEECWFPVVGLSQDCLSEFFDKVRSKQHALPSAQQVLQCIRQFPIFNIFRYSFKKRSSDDLDIFTSHARNMPDIQMYELATSEQYVGMSGDESAEFYAVEIQTDNKKERLALYLLYKGYKAHCRCRTMRDYTGADDYVADRGSMPFLYRKINTIPRKFLEFVEVMELNFRDYFEKNALTMSFSELTNIMKNVTFEMPCKCFPLLYIKEVFIRFRIHTLLRYNNKVFRDKDLEKKFVIDDL